MSEESHSENQMLNWGLPKALSKWVLRTFGGSPLFIIASGIALTTHASTQLMHSKTKKSGVRFIP